VLHASVEPRLWAQYRPACTRYVVMIKHIVLLLHDITRTFRYLRFYRYIDWAMTLPVIIDTQVETMLRVRGATETGFPTPSPISQSVLSQPRGVISSYIQYASGLPVYLVLRRSHMTKRSCVNTILIKPSSDHIRQVPQRNSMCTPTVFNGVLLHALLPDAHGDHPSETSTRIRNMLQKLPLQSPTPGNRL